MFAVLSVEQEQAEGFADMSKHWAANAVHFIYVQNKKARFQESGSSL
jgi:hypothetical protein